jgi:hypothetical protein
MCIFIQLSITQRNFETTAGVIHEKLNTNFECTGTSYDTYFLFCSMFSLNQASSYVTL